MANADLPSGLRPVRHRNGAPWNGAVTAYYVPAGYGTALFIGDPVVKTGTSNSVEVTAPGAGQFAPGTMAAINKATAGTGNGITGVIVGFAGDADDPIYNPASTERVAFVCDDPDVMFEIQADGSIAATQIGLNGVLIYTNSGSTGSGISGAELDSGTTTAPASTAAFQLKIHALSPRVDNELGAFAKMLVSINNHTEVNGASGI